LPELSDPLQVGDFTLRNRIVLPPMQSGRATLEGAVTNRLVNYYAVRSGFLGLPIVEHAYVSLIGKLGAKQLGIYDDSLIVGLKKLASSIHEAGAPAVLQITHAGCVANKKIINAEPVGPSAREKSRELQVMELESVAEEFALAAGRAVKAGFDGVELHGAHGYLLNQFFSPLFNKRQDEFGGSFENRVRFPLMVVERVREALDGGLLLYRLGADDLDPLGIRIEDSVAFAVKLEQSGVDVIDVSGGMCGSDPKQLRRVKGYFVPQASHVKRAVKVPVIGVGRITQAEQADKFVRDGLVDLVAVGRAFLRDPQWAEKALQSARMRA
jgi:NADPH2 dehydrogenase